MNNTKSAPVAPNGNKPRYYVEYKRDDGFVSQAGPMHKDEAHTMANAALNTRIKAALANGRFLVVR